MAEGFMNDKRRDGIESGKGLEIASIMECNECTCFNLRKAARVVTQIFDNALRSIDLRATQYTLLALVFALGPITVTKLSDEMVSDRTTLSRNLNPMEKSGLIRITQGSDKRTRIVAITDIGRRKLEEAYPLWKKAQRAIKEAMGTDKWSSLMSNASDLVNLARPDRGASA
jgi:DNA-binding MarR family transcriptional regulator